jgi:DNA-binding MarR family transcriptional regulator
LYNTTHDNVADAFPDDWFRRLLRGLVRAGRLLEPHEHAGLHMSMSEVFAIGELADAGTLSQRELGERLGLEKSTVSRLAADLERRGWLSRERDPANRRFYRLQLTPHGQVVAKRVGAHFRSYHNALFETLTADERAGLEIGLAGLIRAFDAQFARAAHPHSSHTHTHTAHRPEHP